MGTWEECNKSRHFVSRGFRLVFDGCAEPVQMRRPGHPAPKSSQGQDYLFPAQTPKLGL